MSDVLRTDIHEILTDSNIPWERLKGCAVLVTGATGLVGSLLIRAMSAANTEFKLNMKLIAHGRNTGKGNALTEECGAEFISCDISEPFPAMCLPDTLDYVFHCAAITKSSDMTAKPADVISTMVDGTKNALETALEKRCRGFLYLSSMEVYGRPELPEVDENDLGYLNLSNPRSCYPESKRLCETMCAAYAVQYGLPVKIARLARTFGAGVKNEESDARVANQFVNKALANEDIELHTPGNSIANCCYSADTVRGLLTVLLKGKDGESYNIANSAASATIREMAEILANKVCGGKIKVVVNVPEDIMRHGYAPDVCHTINADKLKDLGWTPKYGLEEMLRRMLADRREQKNIKTE